MTGDALKDWQNFVLQLAGLACLTFLVATNKADMMVWLAVAGPMLGAHVATRSARAGANTVIAAGNSFRPGPYPMTTDAIPSFKPPPNDVKG